MKSKLTAKEQKQLELGRRLENLLELGYVTKKEAMLFSFLKGVAGGFGAFVGGSIVVAIVLWIVSRIDNLSIDQLIN